MYEKLSKLQKMYGEFVLFTISLLLIVALFSNLGKKDYYNKLHNKTEAIYFDEDDDSAIIAPYIIGFFLWGIYCIVWYIRIYLQSNNAVEAEKSSYKNTINIGCLPIGFLLIIVLIMFNIFVGR
jgi:NADH:ubiquinone oxidoreductase subunit 5 (subunit L)/multisubunit Na+/H+ antiporter MnhA subunit